MGSAHVPRARRRSVRGDPRRPRLGRHRPHRDVHRGRASGSRRAQSSRPTSIVTATGLNLLPLGGIEITVDGQRRRASGDPDLQGDDAQRRAEPRVRARLHERVVDAQVRADLRVRLPAAQPHGRARLPRSCTPRNRDPSVTDEPFIDFTSGYVQRSIDQFPKQGSKTPVAAAPELRARPRAAALRRARGRRDRVLETGTVTRPRLPPDHSPGP